MWKVDRHSLMYRLTIIFRRRLLPPPRKALGRNLFVYEHTIKTLHACKPSYRRSRMSPSSSHPQIIIFMMRAKRSVRWHSHRQGHSADSSLPSVTSTYERKVLVRSLSKPSCHGCTIKIIRREHGATRPNSSSCHLGQVLPHRGHRP